MDQSSLPRWVRQSVARPCHVIERSRTRSAWPGWRDQGELHTEAGWSRRAAQSRLTIAPRIQEDDSRSASLGLLCQNGRQGRELDTLLSRASAMTEIPKRRHPLTPAEERRNKARFIQKSEARWPMQIVLEFTRPVSLADQKQIARRVLDRLHLDLADMPDPGPLAAAKITCHGLSRIIRIELDSDGEPA